MVTTTEKAVEGEVFDSCNIAYLVSHFSIAELRKEANHADIERSISEALGDSEGESYWEQFYSVVSQALTEKQSSLSK